MSSTYDLSRWKDSLGAGVHKITVKTRADGIRTSKVSNEVLYVIVGVLKPPTIARDGPVLHVQGIDENGTIIAVSMKNGINEFVFIYNDNSDIELHTAKLNIPPSIYYVTVSIKSEAKDENGDFILDENGNKIIIGESGESDEIVIVSGSGTPGLEYKKELTYYVCSGIGTATDLDILIPGDIFDENGDAIANMYGIEAFAFSEKPITSAGIDCHHIGSGAFQNCAELTSVVFTERVIGIDSTAFYNCDKLASVTIPDSVETLGELSFAYCDSLIRADIGSGITTMGDGTFSSCVSLSTVNIKNGAALIGSQMFYGCTSLISIDIPRSVEHVGWGAFERCTSLQTINFKGTSAEWRALEKGSDWADRVPATVVHCADGVDVPIDE